MAQYDGSIRINTLLNTSGLRRGEGEIRGSMSRISDAAKKMTAVIASAFALRKVVQFGKEMLDLGSDLQEVQNVVDVTFTTMSDKVDKFAKNAAVSAGLSETMAKKYVGTFGAMSKSFGFSEQAAYDMSTALTQLSGDVASFYNISQDEAYIKLKSVFTGETETLKDLGVVMTQSALDAYALANGFGKTTSAMSENEKVALRFQFVMQQLSGASGDFMRTSGGWANQVRILKLQFDSLKATIGQGLINIFTPVVKIINVLLGKLATLANAFKAFTELITGNKAKSGGSTGLSKESGEDIGAGYNAAADGAENLAAANNDAAKSAGKAAKAAKGQLSTLDKLNNISSQSSGSGSSGGGAGGGSGGAFGEVDYGKVAEGDSIFEKMGSSIDAIIKKLKELAGLFKEGFFDGLGDYKPKLEELKNDILSIGNTLKEIFTDPAVMSSANNFAKQLAYSLGQIAGSVASIGLTIAQLIVGGIEKYLTQSKDRIKQYIISMFNIGTEIAAIIGDFSVAFADIFSVFGSDTAQQITGNLIGVFAEVKMMISENAAKLGRDILSMIAQPIIDNKEKIKTAIEGVLAAIEPFTSGILTAVQTVRDAVSDIYDNHLKPLFDSITKGISDVLGKLLDGFNTYMLPILQGLGEKFKEMMEGPFGEAVNKISGFIGKLIDALKLLWENILVPFFGWIANNIMPVLAPIADFIGKTVLSVIKTIINVVGDLAEVLGGIIDFIVGVFTGDWEKAWEGIKSIFSGVWNAIKDLLGGIWDVIKSLVKTGIDFVKSVIKAGWDAVKLVTSTIWSAIKGVLSTVWSAIKGIFSGVGGWFKDKFETAYNNVKNAFSGAKEFFSGVWSNIKGVFGNISGWFKDKFSAAWEAVKKVFSAGGKIFDGIKDGILNGLKAVINAIIGGINKVIAIPFNGLNAALKKIKSIDILGLKPFNWISPIKVPQITPLATGTVVPPNREFLALLGDNKKEPEVVSPISTMKQAVMEAIAESGITSGGGNDYGDIVVMIDGREVFRAVRKQSVEYKKQTGKPAFS